MEPLLLHLEKDREIRFHSIINFRIDLCSCARKRKFPAVCVLTMVHEVDIAEIPLKRSQETFVDEPECILDVNDWELTFDLEHGVKNINSLHVFHAIVVLRNTVEVIMKLQQDPELFQRYRMTQLSSLGIKLDDSGAPTLVDDQKVDITTPPQSPPLKVQKVSKESLLESIDKLDSQDISTADGEEKLAHYIPIEVLVTQDLPHVTDPICSYNGRRIFKEMEVTQKQKAAAQFLHLLKSFNLASEPTISVESFLIRINTYSSSTSVLVYIHAALLIFKLAVIMDVLPLTIFNVHRVILSLIRCLTKKLEDVYQTQTNYATVVGVSKKDLYKLEVGFLFLCNFQLVVGENILNDFIKLNYVDLLHTNIND